MDITEYFNAAELRARIFSCQARLQVLKDKRKKHHSDIRATKNLIKNIERCIDKKCDSELQNFEVSSVVLFLKFLRENLIDLDDLWQNEVQLCVKLHNKMDEIGERVYL
ncbi:MAG: hypothetical protein ACK5GV_01090 [Bacteroidota bacterium]|jgi:hypothetical protein